MKNNTIDVALSIIIPCYNNGIYLKEMIECFLNQTRYDWEMIIVDDGSTDNTADIVREYSDKDKRITLYLRDRLPKGSAVCRNIGFQKSIGKYICHLDADDLVSKTFVENRVRFMEENPDIDYATFKAITFENGTERLINNKKKANYGVGINTNDLLEDFLTVHYSFSVWNNIYKRESLLFTKWDERVKIYTDFSFIVPIILKGLSHKFSELQQADYYYRIFPNKPASTNMCSNFVSDEKCKSTIYLFSKTILNLNNLPDGAKRIDQFLEFIVLNFERLMKSKQVQQIDLYIEFVKKFYPAKISYKFQKIYTQCFKAKNNRRFNLSLYYYLVTLFKYKRYNRYLLNSFVKYLVQK